MTENREPGWYWVRGADPNSPWVPWEWIGESSVLKARWADCGEEWIVEARGRIPTPDEISDPVIMPRAVYELLYAKKPDRIDRGWSHGQLSAAPKPGGES